MKLSEKKRIMLTTAILASFVLIISLISLYVEMSIQSGNVCGCVIPIYLFIPISASLGLLVGSSIYYLILSTKEVRERDWSIIAKLLDEEERRVLEEIVEKGEITQARIVKNTGLSRVKVHRILKKFERNGLIEKVRERKVNIIKLK